MMNKLRADTPFISKWEQLKWTLLSTALFFIIGNGYAYLNFYWLHDELNHSFHISGDWQIQLGRFLIPVYTAIRKDISIPLVIGVLSCLYLGMSIFLITSIMHLKNRLHAILVSGFLCINIFTLEIAAVHQYFSDIFLLAMLLSCVGTYFIYDHYSFGRVGLAICFFFCSFGLYPAFITFPIILFGFTLLKNASENKSIQSQFEHILIWAATLFIAGILYRVASVYALRMCHTSPSSVAWSMFTIGRLSIPELWTSIIYNYGQFIELFVIGNVFAGRSVAIATFFLCFLSVCIFVIAPRKNRTRTIILTILMVLLFPLISRLVNIMTGSKSAFRTMFAQYMIYPISIWFFYTGSRSINDERIKRYLTVFITVLSAIIIFENALFTNGGFTFQRVLHERAVYHTERVLDEYLDSYDRNKPVAIVGVFNINANIDNHFEKYKSVDGFGQTTGITYEDTFASLCDMLGYRLNWNPSYTDRAKTLAEVREMPCYPENGYMKDIGDYIVIKLSDSH